MSLEFAIVYDTSLDKHKNLSIYDIMEIYANLRVVGDSMFVFRIYIFSRIGLSRLEQDLLSYCNYNLQLPTKEESSLESHAIKILYIECSDSQAQRVSTLTKTLSKAKWIQIGPSDGLFGYDFFTSLRFVDSVEKNIQLFNLDHPDDLRIRYVDPSVTENRIYSRQYFLYLLNNNDLIRHSSLYNLDNRYCYLLESSFLQPKFHKRSVFGRPNPTYDNLHFDIIASLTDVLLLT